MLMTWEDSPLATSQEIVPWLAAGELAKIHIKNTDGVWCLSWVVGNKYR